MDKKWQFGKAGDRYPVKYGDIWRCGDQRIFCVDWEKAKGIGDRRFSGNDPFAVDVVYTDPPWGDGAMKGFRTRSLQHGISKKAEEDYLGLIKIALSEIHKSRLKAVYMEMGERWGEDTETMLRDMYRSDTEKWCVTYSRSRYTSLLFHVSINGADTLSAPYPDFDFSNINSFDLPRIVMERTESIFSGAVICDPFCGTGLTLLAAAKRGLTGTGVEMNPRKVACALDRLSNLTNFTPEYEGRI